MKQRTWENILKLKETGEIVRMGIPFSTSCKNYFYDAGTGKVVELNVDEKEIIDSLFDATISIERASEIISKLDYSKQFLKSIISENLFASPILKKFIPLEYKYQEENMEIQQLIIELTGRCNLRCKYCIYNDYYEGNRNFNTEDITFETAKKAIDYVYQHRSPERLAITFYGGEPLLNFDVMKQCIDYSLENLKNCNDLSFSFTTNLTLMTEEIADYLGKIPNLSIVLSLDGPAEIQNSARVYSNNKSTFDDAYRGLKYISEAAKKYGKLQFIFNSVLMPPYSEEKYNQINEFFSGLDFLPENTSVRTSYPCKGSLPQSYYTQDDPITIFEWATSKYLKPGFSNNKQNIYSVLMETALVKIHNRQIYDEPINCSFYNGCCVPGQRRLYVCTNGLYKVCERVGNTPYIGHVDQGINIEILKEYYLKQYEQKSIKYCSNCWAFRLCDLCYADCYDENGLNIETKLTYCDGIKDRYKKWLILYHSALENEPKIIEEIDKLEIT